MARTFEIGFVSAGAVSGASVGAMCAALAAVSICEGSTKKMYQSWVDDIDIMPLLDTSDIKGKEPLNAVLNCNILDKIASTALSITPKKRNWYPFLDDSLELFLTVTNLNGVAYGIDMKGATGNQYIMTTHADHFHFNLFDPNIATTLQPYHVKQLQADNSVYDENWKLLQMAGLATGAFPIALLSRRIKTGLNNYRYRDMSSPFNDNPWSQYIVPLNIPEQETDFLFVDGGMMNNEPFELVHRAMSKGGSNPRKGSDAHRAVVMIDPFPSERTFKKPEEYHQSIPKLAGYLYGALRQNSKFKLDELRLALDEDVYSRFIIAPIREGAQAPDPQSPPLHIAGGLFDGFGGFLDKSFRQHDFVLGRRNTQHFLRKHFILPESNTLFDEWTQPMRQQYYVKDETGRFIREKGDKFLPIIPLVTPETNAEIKVEAWPKMKTQRLKEVRKAIDDRIEKIGKIEIDNHIKSRLLNFISNIAMKALISNKISHKVADEIEEALNKYDLIEK